MNMEPGNTMEYTPGKGKSSSKPSFWGSMLIFGGVTVGFLTEKVTLPKFNHEKWPKPSQIEKIACLVFQPPIFKGRAVKLQGGGGTG